MSPKLNIVLCTITISASKIYLDLVSIIVNLSQVLETQVSNQKNNYYESLLIFLIILGLTKQLRNISVIMVKGKQYFMFDAK